MIKKGDAVLVISGKDKGKSGKVSGVLPKANKIIVEGVNLRKKSRRAKRAGEKGQIIQINMPVNRSDVMLICPQCGKATRKAAAVLEGKKKMRLCKKCGAAFI